jgi:hypothetical protein
VGRQMPRPGPGSHNRLMDDETCPHDPAELAQLRDWAWSRGRTDVVLDLDLHAGAWLFQSAPSRANLVRLAALFPEGTLPPDLEGVIRDLVAQGGDPRQLAAVQTRLRTWSAGLCHAVAADLSESAAD